MSEMKQEEKETVHARSVLVSFLFVEGIRGSRAIAHFRFGSSFSARGLMQLQ